MLFHWNFDPVLFQVGPLSIHWYGLIFAGAFIAGQAMFSRMLESEHVQVDADALLVYSLIGTIVGARIAHCIFYDPSYYLAHPRAVLRIWEGGLASHGGVVGMMAGLWWSWRKFEAQVPYLWLLDRVTVPAAFGAMLVRLANFLNSEIVGVPTGSEVWGVVFEVVDEVPRHPAQLYEGAGYGLIFVALFIVHRRVNERLPVGMLLGWFMVSVFSLRFAVEFIKAPQAVYELAPALSVGQLLSVPFALLGFFFVILSRSRSTATKLMTTTKALARRASKVAAGQVRD
jgi:phosphatidylglycerol:prolipoprotein diacylglycerol transferase